MQSELDELPEDVRQEIFKHLTNPVDRLSMAQVNRKGLKSIKFLEKLDPQLTHMMNLKRIGERQRGLAGRPQSNLRFENSIQYQSEEGS